MTSKHKADVDKNVWDLIDDIWERCFQGFLIGCLLLLIFG